MLKGNDLSLEQIKYLWVDMIESCFMFLLEGDKQEAFTAYEDYLNDHYF